MIYTAAVAVSMLALGSAELFTKKPSEQMTMWLDFKEKFHKSYGSVAEEGNAFQTFLENLKIADGRNAKEKKHGGNQVHGITKFSDMSQQDFSNHILMKGHQKHVSSTNSVHTNVETPSVPVLVDWTGIYTTPVKNQGQCGSCWAFSVTEQIESDSMRLLDTSYILGPEQIVECDKTSQGCNGGYTEHAYDYIKKAGGIETETQYPYTSFTGRRGKCKSPSSFVLSLDSYSVIAGSSTSDTESEMTTYVQTTGPLSICLDASNWNSYTGGIMTVCGQDVDHCVQAVGVYPASKDGYWKVRNQWGKDWGEEGYIQLAYGQNTCDLTDIPTHTIVSNVTVTSANAAQRLRMRL